MTEHKKGIGRCLCSAVEITVERLSNKVGACHCAICRKWGSGPFMAVEAGTAVSIQGDEHISIFNSSDWAERGFCQHCGTHLFYRLKENNYYFIPADLFDDGPEFIFESQVFIDEKPNYYCFANRTKDMTGAECFAEFGDEN